MMPRPLCQGGFDVLPLDPSLGALWLREILKATLLSFMAKAAASENLRSIAGYHIRSANSSTLEYSRDSMAPSLHFLEGMFIAIKGGIFAPDSTRAGRWTGGIRSIEEALRFLSGVQPDPPDDRPPPADAPEIEPGDQSDPESAAESIGTEGEADEAVASAFFLGEDLNVSAEARSFVKCFRHRMSGVVHAARDGQPADEGEMTVFRCGRFANRNYEELDETPAIILQKCSSCWGASDSGL
ncbi:HMCN1 [Symbiodinium sp. CCMP2592]|nr:HMCN1 [Symbiodinium sp. CCMP2592]CAE7725328.1 HMCN1 [Symbiodinium sp. CCMP2592]